MGGTTVFAYLGRVYIPYTYAYHGICVVSILLIKIAYKAFLLLLIKKKDATNLFCQSHTTIMSVPYNTVMRAINIHYWYQ